VGSFVRGKLFPVPCVATGNSLPTAHISFRSPFTEASAVQRSPAAPPLRVYSCIQGSSPPHTCSYRHEVARTLPQCCRPQRTSPAKGEKINVCFIQCSPTTILTLIAGPPLPHSCHGTTPHDRCRLPTPHHLMLPPWSLPRHQHWS